MADDADDLQIQHKPSKEKIHRAWLPHRVVIDERIPMRDRGNALLLYLFLDAACCGKPTSRWSVDRIGKAIGWKDDRTPRRLLQVLEEAGFIEVTRRVGRSNLVRVVKPRDLYSHHDETTFLKDASVRSKRSPQSIPAEDPSQPMGGVPGKDPSQPMGGVPLPADGSPKKTSSQAVDGLEEKAPEADREELADPPPTSADPSLHTSEENRPDGVGESSAPDTRVRRREDSGDDLNMDGGGAEHATGNAAGRRAGGSPRRKSSRRRLSEFRPSVDPDVVWVHGEWKRLFEAESDRKARMGNSAWVGVFVVPPMGKDATLLKTLLTTFGKEKLTQMMACLLMDWSAFRDLGRCQAMVPTVGILWAYRTLISGAVDAGTGLVTTLHRYSEWKKTTRPKGAATQAERIFG